MGENVCTEMVLKDLNRQIIVEYNQRARNKVAFIMLLVALCLGLGGVAVTLGPVEMTVTQAYQAIGHKMFPTLVGSPGEAIERVVWIARFPRFLSAMLVGVGLAVAGAVMQPVLRNPMASPFTLGISSGAGFGAAIAIVMEKSIVGGPYAIVVNAFLFAALTSIAVLFLSKRNGVSPASMILAGIAFSFFFNALTALLKYFANPWALSEIVVWLMGSLAKGTWGTLGIVAPIIIGCVAVLTIKSWELNAIGVGDDAAKSMGVNVERTRMLLMLVSSLLTATIVCFTGTIGFVGLVGPHIARMAIGGDNRFVIPAAGIIGGLMLVLSDVVAMNLLSPIILPIGVVTSMLGTPVFLHLIFRRHKGG